MAEFISATVFFTRSVATGVVPADTMKETAPPLAVAEFCRKSISSKCTSALKACKKPPDLALLFRATHFSKVALPPPVMYMNPPSSIAL